MSVIDFKKQIRAQFLRQRSVDRASPEMRAEYAKQIRKEIKRSGFKFNQAQIESLCQDLLDDIFGYGPLQKLIEDPKVAEIMVNGPFHIFIEVDGVQLESTTTFDDELHLLEVLNRLVRRANQRIDEAQPTVDCVIDGTIRLNAAIGPVAINGPLLTIRKPRSDIQEIEDLLSRGSLNPAIYQFLWACIQARINIMFSGATGTGKTTLLEVLSSYISDQERIVIIEDVPELRVRQHNVARLCTRSANLEGKGEINLRSLFINSLRMRPTRIILGEIRGAEAFEYLQSLNSGHRGSLAVIHASSPEEVGLRLENLAQLSGLNVPANVLRQQIASGLELIVQIDRYPDGSRKVSRISELMGMGEDATVILRDLFYYKFEGIDPLTQKAVGQHMSTGEEPSFLEDFERYALHLDKSVFQN